MRENGSAAVQAGRTLGFHRHFSGLKFSFAVTMIIWQAFSTQRGGMPNSLGSDVRKNHNAILLGIPQSEWERLRPNLSFIELQVRNILYARQTPVDYVYFLERGFASLMIDFSDGFQAEAGQIGREGMVGVPLLHRLNTDVASAVVQAPSTALRMPASVFLREIPFLPALERRLLTYSETLRAQAMQLAACNGHHGLDRRLARCLLSMQDRYQSPDLPVTHEMLASLLCAHRPSVSVSAKRLQSMGVIRYSGGSLVIVDRRGLEDVSCECYDILHELAIVA